MVRYDGQKTCGLFEPLLQNFHHFCSEFSQFLCGARSCNSPWLNLNASRLQWSKISTLLMFTTTKIAHNLKCQIILRHLIYVFPRNTPPSVHRRDTSITIKFGLKNAPATFQRMIDTALRGLINEHCFAYLDDLYYIIRIYNTRTQ